VISRQLMLSSVDVSAIDVRLETPSDEAEARLEGVSQIVGHRPLSRSIPFLSLSWSYLERQLELHSCSSAQRYVPGRATYRRLPSLVRRLLPRARAMMKDALDSGEAGKVTLSSYLNTKASLRPACNRVSTLSTHCCCQVYHSIPVSGTVSQLNVLKHALQITILQTYHFPLPAQWHLP
jgi:hypothetical protein